MASKASASAALFLAANLLLFSLTAACGNSSYPTPSTPPARPSKGGCPVDTLKFSSCNNVLNGLINVGVGKFPKQPCECCTLLDGLVDFEAAGCLCTAFKAYVLGLHLNIPVNLSLLLNYCGKTTPREFQCA